MALNSLENNSIREVLSIIGDHWTLCVLSEAFYGVRRFADMRTHLAIASNILSDRLARLVHYEVLEQLPYKEAGQRTRYEYQLTRKGEDLFPTLVSLMQWGDRYMPAPVVESAQLTHLNCQQEVHLEVVCEAGHKVTSVNELRRTVRLKDNPAG